jgi:type VI secretion system protein ImpL
VNSALVQQVAALRANASRFPAPFDQMIRNAANDFEGDATGVTVASMQQGLADSVTRICQQIVTNRYPFLPGGDREVALADFSRLFAPSGIFDKFFNQHLAPYVDQSRTPWTWRAESRVARSLSPVTLRHFQSALAIRDAFFATGGNMPSFSISITPQTLSGDAVTARLEVDGTAVTSQQGVNTPSTVQWPGPIPRSSITIGGGGGGFFSGGFFSKPSVLQRDGQWSFFRLLESGTVLRHGDALIASFVVGGREVSYQINVGSLMNPLQLEAMREFRCPIGI